VTTVQTTKRDWRWWKKEREERRLRIEMASSRWPKIMKGLITLERRMKRLSNGHLKKVICEGCKEVFFEHELDDGGNCYLCSVQPEPDGEEEDDLQQD
jgi:hypothetical protein